MTVRFIGQGYNLPTDTSLAQELINQFADTDFNEFMCLVAFASSAGVYGLAKHVQRARHLKKVQVVVGIDQDGTSKEALEGLLRWRVPCFVYHNPIDITFHPKVYLFKGNKKSLIIIGSNNLTFNSLAHNVESSLAVEFDNTDSAGTKLLAEIEDYFGPLLRTTKEPTRNLYRLNKEIIARLVRQYHLPTDKELKVRYADGKRKTVSQKASEPAVEEPLFKPENKQQSPIEFDLRPRAKATSGEVPEVAMPEEETPAMADVPTLALNQYFSEVDKVLIAEMNSNGPNNYGQFSPRKEYSISFFGRSSGMPSQSIILVNITSDGNTQFEGAKQIGYKKRSRNYYFYLGAKTEVPYDTDARPIVVFIRTGADRFLYCLIGPASGAYNELREIIADNSHSGTRLANKVIPVAQLRDACPSLPFWKL